jgi:hypothetical protein
MNDKLLFFNKPVMITPKTPAKIKNGGRRKNRRGDNKKSSQVRHILVDCSKQCITLSLVYSLIFKKVLWRRVGNFVLFLHDCEFASQQWSARHPNPMLENAAPPADNNRKARTGPVAPRQRRNVLYNRDLCRIISSFIRA